MKKKIILLVSLLSLILIYTYILAIEKIPDSIIIFEGETIKVNNYLGFKLNSNNTIETSASSSKTITDVGKKQCKSVYLIIFL